MWESIWSQYDEVHEILRRNKELKYLYAIDKDVLSHIVSFLEHFKSASEMAYTEKHPTLHLVVPLYERLLTTVCAVNENDIEAIRILKTRARQLLPLKVRLDVIHDVAAFLNPCMKGLSFLVPARKKVVLEKVRQLLAEVQAEQTQTLVTDSDDENLSIASHKNADTEQQPLVKKIKLDDFSDLCDKSDNSVA